MPGLNIHSAAIDRETECRTRPCENAECALGGTVFTTRRTGPIPRYHPACWRIARGGAPSMSTYSKRKAKGLCVVCEDPSGKHSYCEDCRRIRREERKTNAN